MSAERKKLEVLWSWVPENFQSFCFSSFFAPHNTAVECVVECCQWWAGPGICRRWANSPLRIPTSNTFFFPIFFSTIFYFLFFPLPGYYLEQMSIKISFSFSSWNGVEFYNNNKNTIPDILAINWQSQISRMWGGSCGILNINCLLFKSRD